MVLFFEAGTSGFVEISNRSASGTVGADVVVADAIPFGNGAFEINGNRLDLEEMNGEYWFRVNQGQGRIRNHAPDANGDNALLRSVSNDPGNNDALSHSNQFNAAIRLTKTMNRSQDGSIYDRVYVSMHANASLNGNARGAIANMASNANNSFPEQATLAGILGREVDRDLQTAIGAPNRNPNSQQVTGITGSPPFEVDTWVRRRDIGDSNNNEPNFSLFGREVPNALIEVGFHDNADDSRLMRDPAVTDLAAGAIYHAITKYFSLASGGANDPGGIRIDPGETIAIPGHGWQTGDQVTYSNAVGDEYFGVVHANENLVADVGGLTRVKGKAAMTACGVTVVRAVPRTATFSSPARATTISMAMDSRMRATFRLFETTTAQISIWRDD